MGNGIYKLSSDKSLQYFALPVEVSVTMLSPNGIVWMGRLWCGVLQDLVNALEMDSERIASDAWRSKWSTIKQDLQQLLLIPVELAIDTHIAFDGKKFADYCKKQNMDGAYHILIPLHVSEDLKDTLDDNQAMYGIGDDHVYLTRDYLIQYGAKVVYDAVSDPSILDRILLKKFNVPNRN